MAQKKKKSGGKAKTAPARTTRETKTAQTRSAAPRSQKQQKVRTQEQLEARTQKFAIVLFAIAIFTTALILIEGESVWTSLHNFILGLLGACAIILPILLFYIAVVTAMKKLGGRLHTKVWITVVIVILISTTIYAFRASSLPENLTYFETLHDLYARGVDRPDSMTSRIPADAFTDVRGEMRPLHRDPLDAIVSALAWMCTLCTAFI